MSTITEPKPSATAPVRARVPEPNRIVLHGIPWSVYNQLRAADPSDSVRMSYWNGTLELMSPEYIHEKAERRLNLLITEVLVQRKLPHVCTGSTTFRRAAESSNEGAGKEPDTSFYLRHASRVRNQSTIDLDRDPPPDLAVEVDNTTDSAGKLPIYAVLGVPEVWRYDVQTHSLWFGTLGPEGSYRAIDRSECLPMLTPALVLEGISLGAGDSDDTDWLLLLRDWVREVLR